MIVMLCGEGRHFINRRGVSDNTLGSQSTLSLVNAGIRSLLKPKRAYCSVVSAAVAVTRIGRF